MDGRRSGLLRPYTFDPPPNLLFYPGERRTIIVMSRDPDEGLFSDAVEKWLMFAIGLALGLFISRLLEYWM
jgi:hypothetical protein